MPTIELDGTTYDVDLDHVTVKEMRLLKEHGGLTVASLATGYMQGDVDAMQGLVFLAKRRAGEAVRWRDLEDLDLTALIRQIKGPEFAILMIAMGPRDRQVDRLRALADEIEAAELEAAEEAVDPTTPAGPPPSETSSSAG